MRPMYKILVKVRGVWVQQYRVRPEDAIEKMEKLEAQGKEVRAILSMPEPKNPPKH